MKVNIEARGFTLTPAMRVWVNQQIGSSLTKLAKDMRGIDVTLSKTGGPNGPEGKLAAFNLYLKHRSPIRIKTVHANLYSAIAISAQRSELAVMKATTTTRRSVRANQRRLRHLTMVAAPM